MEDETRERLVNGSVWLRGLHMVIFLIAYNIAELILVLLAIFQFLAVLITGRANEALLRFGRNLSIYVEEIFEFLTFNSEVRPFPFEPWPDEPAGGEAWLSDTADAPTAPSGHPEAETPAPPAPPAKPAPPEDPAPPADTPEDPPRAGA